MAELTTRRAPDFKIISGLLKASRGDDGRMRLHGVASSTTRDLHGDTMLPTALDDMERAANNNLTIFLNHSYDVPEDVAGSVEHARIKTRGVDHVGNPNYDLEFDIVVNDANERAIKTFEAIERGVKLGLSIGAAIPDGGAAREKKSGALVISHVELLETSLVGIPANPRSWVEYAVKNFNGRELPMIEDADEPEITAAACSCEPGCDHEDCACGAHKAVEVLPLVASTDTGTETYTTTTIDHIETNTTTDIANATVTVWPSGKVSVNTDTDSPEPPNASQDAPESQPENEATVMDSAEPVEEPVTPAALKDGAELIELLQGIATATGELAELRMAKDAAVQARIAAELERDQVVRGAVVLLRDIKRLLDRIADTPLSRKTQFRNAQSEFESRYGGVIDEDVLKMLLR